MSKKEFLQSDQSDDIFTGTPYQLRAFAKHLKKPAALLKIRRAREEAAQQEGEEALVAQVMAVSEVEERMKSPVRDVTTKIISKLVQRRPDEASEIYNKNIALYKGHQDCFVQLHRDVQIYVEEADMIPFYFPGLMEEVEAMEAEKRAMEAMKRKQKEEEEEEEKAPDKEVTPVGAAIISRLEQHRPDEASEIYIRNITLYKDQVRCDLLRYAVQRQDTKKYTHLVSRINGRFKV